MVSPVLPADSAAGMRVSLVIRDGPAERTHPAQDNVARVKPPNIPARYDGVD